MTLIYERVSVKRRHIRQLVMGVSSITSCLCHSVIHMIQKELKNVEKESKCVMFYL